MAHTGIKQHNKEKGDDGERLALEYLVEQGYEIRELNWKWYRLELDIVAVKGNVIVFVEVKTRYSNTYGEPWEAVNTAKRNSIMKAADAYIKQYDIYEEPRFDIVSILKIGQKVTIQHLEGAFWPVA